MASTTTTEASEIRRKGRQRLIGAVAIAVLLVVFVPMILDSEQRPSRSGPSTDIPSRDKAPPLPPASAPLIPHKPLPPEAPPANTAAPVTPAKAGAQPEPAKGSQPAPEPAKAAPAPAKPPVEASAPAKSPAPAAAPALVGFAVQVGAFKDDEKLKQARERLAAVGVPHYTERREGASGELTRLRAGPFPTREAAEAALAKIKLGALDGQVVPLP
jgi:DedD protein